MSHAVRRLAAIALPLLAAFSLSTCTPAQSKVPIDVLILAKFEVDALSGDSPGEAQYYYDAYLAGGDEYTLSDGRTLYAKDGVALAVTGMGKVNAALTTMSILTDERFDFSDAYVISTGCAGSAKETTVMGDVFVVSAAIDYDLGHHADIREMENAEDATWFHDQSFDKSAYVLLDPTLTSSVYELVKDIPLKTTERTRSYMSAAFDGAAWATRDPKVLRGTTVSGDNYWKGEFDHRNALAEVKTYQCPDPFVATEMEDVAIARTMERMGMLDHLIILRDSVNMDVFMCGNTPETLWAPERSGAIDVMESGEYADIFTTAMQNNFAVGSVVVDAIRNDELMG